MTQEIEQITDFHEIEDAIELWAATGSALPQMYDKDKEESPKVMWQGFDFIRKRPYGTLSIVSDLSPGRSGKIQDTITEDGVVKIRTRYGKLFKWNVQFSVFQDSYDGNGNSIRETAREYAKNLADRYDIPSLQAILRNAGIVIQPIDRNVRPGLQPSVDDDKYIHDASVEFQFSGTNVFDVKDSDYFITIEEPTVTLHGDNV